MAIFERFRQIAELNKGQTAIIDGDREYTYQELLDLSECYYRKIPEQAKAIGVIMSHGINQIAAIMGILEAGCAYIPAEPDFPASRIKSMMDEGQADFAFVDEAKGEERFGVAEKDINSPDSPINAVQTDGLAYVLFTSGTTGKPKGVRIKEDNVLSYVDAFQNEFNLTGEDVMLQNSVCTFDIFVEEVFASLLSGAKLAIIDSESKKNTGDLLSFCAKHGVTVISGFPYLLQSINSCGELPKSLRLLLSGGDVLRRSYVDNLLGKVEVYNTYGPSETTVCAAYYNCSKGRENDDGTYPIGKAIKGYELVIEKDGKTIKEPFEKGEIVIFGGGVGDGYMGASSKEARNFSFTRGRRCYYSGDLAYYDEEGNLNFVGRNDNQIMVYGKRVEIMEVENCLLHTLYCREACVVPYVDGKGLYHLQAHIAPRQEESAIIEALRENLPPYMIPESFVFHDKLPLNENGKIDRRRLRIQIRRLGLEDMAIWSNQRMKVLKEVFSCFNLYFPAEQKKLREANEAEFLKGVKEGTHVAFALFDVNRIVGSGDICYQRELPSPENKSGDSAFLMNVHVDASLRRKGFGKEIMTCLLNEAKDKGITKIYLESSRAGRPLYRLMGFRMLDYYMFYDGK